MKTSIKICPQCKQEFSIPRRHLALRKYCSRKCYWESLKTPWINKICQYCGKEFSWHPKHKSKIGKYCSNECSRKANPPPVRYGPKNNRWNPNLTDEDRNFYKTTYWNNISKQILNRDYHTCQLCGEEQPMLNVHHKILKCEGGDESSDNLITLCIYCHRQVHDKNLNIDACLKEFNNRYKYLESKLR